jgi:predicted transcriptional regulator YdeE
MEIKKCIKETFSVIGKEGSTENGDGFIMRLWEDANANFNEIASLGKKDDHGNLLGIWGVMSDLSRSFNPWEDNFTKGLYLAGIEVVDDAQPKQGWTKWTIPSYEYIYVKNEDKDTFTQVMKYLSDNNIKLVGAVHDYICPEDGQGYMFFPIRTL